jgi:hypothetical protein
MTDPLDKLTREARTHLGAKEAREVDWSRVEAGLFARIDAERREERSRLVPARRWWSTLMVPAAAAVALLAFAVHGGKAPAPSATRDAAEGGGRILAIEGQGQAFIDGRPASKGALVNLGDVLETRGVDVTIERPGKLTLRVEGGTRATVTHTDGSLVLALAEGAVEAQVVPVPSGEAFAVDVAGSRVAVHGTHLRVARAAGDRVAVDLNEGVIAVGNAPRIGSVMGALVTAPAHAEFAAADVGGTLKVTHDRTGVRPPVALGPTPPLHGPAFAASGAAEAEPAATHAPLSALAAQAAVPVHPAVSALAGQASHAEQHVAAAAPAPAAPQESAEQAVTSAVRGCMAERPSAENVTVVVSTTLHLDLNDDGTVRAARFEPPVAPDVNACAAAAIYRARFTHGGAAALPVDFSN